MDRNVHVIIIVIIITATHECGVMTFSIKSACVTVLFELFLVRMYIFIMFRSSFSIKVMFKVIWP